MSTGGFPGMKLILQLGRQFTKPMSTSIINFAKRHPSFRQHLLITPGRYYHWWDNAIKMYRQADRFNNKKQVEITRIRNIDESKAMEAGAQLMLEALVFLILATFLVYESSKSATRSQLLEDTKEQDFVEILRRKDDLSRRLEHQAALIQDLRLRILNYSEAVGYSLPRLPETLEDRDIKPPNSEDSA